MSIDSENPLVSVLIPTFNRCKLVQETIDSVLAQTFKNFELIVIDDGSEDGTNETLNTRYGEKIVYIWQENQGEAVAFNRGISLARGRYIATLGSDDLWSAEKLDRQVPVLENHPDVAVVFCQAWLIDGNGQKISEQPLGANLRSADFTIENLLVRNTIPAGGSTCLIRRSVFEQVGGFTLDIDYGDDWDLWLRLAANSKMEFIAEPLVSYRRHAQTQSFSPNIKRVDDALADHLLLLGRVRNNLPDKIPEHLYQTSIAYQYFKASMSSYLLADVDKGKQRLKNAIELDSDRWMDIDYFLHQVVVFATSYAIDESGKVSSAMCLNFGNVLCSNLPDLLASDKLIRPLKGIIRIQAGFLEYQAGNVRRAARYILQGLAFAPRLVSFAALAILVEPIVGREVVDSLRAFRHRKSLSNGGM